MPLTPHAVVVAVQAAAAKRRGVGVEAAAPHVALALAVLLDASAANARVLVGVVVAAEALAAAEWRRNGVPARSVDFAALAGAGGALTLALCGQGSPSSLGWQRAASRWQPAVGPYQIRPPVIPFARSAVVPPRLDFLGVPLEKLLPFLGLLALLVKPLTGGALAATAAA